MPGIRSIRVFSIIRLEKYAIRRYGNESSTKVFGQTLPNTASYWRIIINTKLPYSSRQESLTDHKTKTAIYYNRHSKELKDIQPGEAVQMRIPGETIWSSGECIRLVGPRSYKIRVGNREYIRNRRQLIPTNKPSESNGIPEIVDERTFFLCFHFYLFFLLLHVPFRLNKCIHFVFCLFFEGKDVTSIYIYMHARTY